MPVACESKGRVVFVEKKRQKVPDVPCERRREDRRLMRRG
jgi:hypothetical protein